MLAIIDFDVEKLDISAIYKSIILIFFSESSCDIYLQVLSNIFLQVLSKTLRLSYKVFSVFKILVPGLKKSASSHYYEPR